MKQLLLFLLPLFFMAGTQAQQKGNIQAKDALPLAGVLNEYVYTPPPGLFLPPRLRAQVIYIEHEPKKKKIIMEQNGNQYRFSFKSPDSSSVLLVTVIDYYNSLVDNNRNKGYLLYLHDKKSNRFQSTNITQAYLLSYANQIYNCQIKNNVPELLNLFESGFKLNPALRNSDYYVSYLATLYKEKHDGVKKQLLDKAAAWLTVKNDEKALMHAYDIYRILNMPEKQKEVDEQCMKAFPKGAVARDKFRMKVFLNEAPDEQQTLSAMEKYQQQFGVNSPEAMTEFYMMLMQICYKKNDIDGVIKYGDLIDNKLITASMLNQLAWELAGNGLQGEAVNLDGAKTLSTRCLYWIHQLKDAHYIPEDPDELIGAEIYYTDTYALVQYKLNNYDSAFYYQQSISGPELTGDEGTERLALYAEKAKGAVFTRELIEPQLIKGVNSPVMLEQLKLIYQQLNLPETAFLKIREQNQVLANKKNREEMMRKYGSEKAPAFTLKDLNGKPVSLLSLRGKVVVLDFWASWCGPCKQSMPIMQELVTRYKDNENVVFLFVDCFERTDAKTTVVNARKFIKDKQYDFNILFATNNIMPDAYNVSSIPTRFVIDKNGTIAFADVSEGQLPAMIDAALEYR